MYSPIAKASAQEYNFMVRWFTYKDSTIDPDVENAKFLANVPM